MTTCWDCPVDPPPLPDTAPASPLASAPPPGVRGGVGTRECHAHAPRGPRPHTCLSVAVRSTCSVDVGILGFESTARLNPQFVDTEARSRAAAVVRTSAPKRMESREGGALAQPQQPQHHLDRGSAGTHGTNRVSSRAADSPIMRMAALNSTTAGTIALVGQRDILTPNLKNSRSLAVWYRTLRSWQDAAMMTLSDVRACQRRACVSTGLDRARATLRTRPRECNMHVCTQPQQAFSIPTYTLPTRWQGTVRVVPTPSPSPTAMTAAPTRCAILKIKGNFHQRKGK